MSYIRLNTTDNTVSNITEKRYTEIYGKEALLNNGVIELEVIETPAPPFNHLTHKLINDRYNRVGDNWVKQWRVVELSDYEIAARDWEHPEWEKRIVAPEALLIQFGTVLTYFQAKGFPTKVTDNWIYLWCNKVLQDHLGLIVQANQVLESKELLVRVVVEDRPLILKPDETPIQ